MHNLLPLKHSFALDTMSSEPAEQHAGGEDRHRCFFLCFCTEPFCRSWSAL